MPDKEKKHRGIHNKGKKYPPEPLSAGEVAQLLAALPNTDCGMRDYAMLVLIYRSGLRVAEAMALFPKDVDRAAGTLRVMHGKGNRWRVVGMDQEAFAVLGRWMDRRSALGHNGAVPLFCALGGNKGRLVTSYVRMILPRLAKKAGLEKRVHPHGLRHAMASELRKEGVDIGVISKQLGHSSIATTARYLDHIAPTAVVDTMRARKWGANRREPGL